MKEQIMKDVIQAMLPHLNNRQLEILKKSLEEALEGKQIQEGEVKEKVEQNNEFVTKFISAKRIEGCSEKSLFYYENTINAMLSAINKNIKHIVTDDLRNYLTEYQKKNEISKVTVDNIRRILSSFFSWLEDEDYILKSPARRIHKVKATLYIKNTYSDEEIERMRDACVNDRDLAIIDMLASTGMRVGEMVTLKRTDVNFQERECVVLGKGDKQRTVYFDARTKIHLQRYLNARTDKNESLFISLRDKSKPLGIGGVENLIRTLGKTAGISKAHPHKFRRTLATGAIDKGMPIEQVQQLLGHQKNRYDLDVCNGKAEQRQSIT